MWLLDKKYEFMQEDRRLEVIIKFSARKYIKKIDQYLMETRTEFNSIVYLLNKIWENSEGAKLHPIMRFIFLSILPGTWHESLMDVPTKEAIYGNIYVSTANLSQIISERRKEFRNYKKFINFFWGVVEHEIAHLY